MKKAYIAAVLIFFSCINSAFAQDSTENSDQNWDNVIHTYDNAQITNPVTDDQYNQALRTIKDYKTKGKGKKNKDSKDKKGKNSKGKSEKKEPVIFDVPASRDPLLRLPANVYYNDQILDNGFYLVNAFFRDNKTYLRIKQGDKFIEVEAKELSSDDKTPRSRTSSASSEVIDGKKVRINYCDRAGCLQTELPIFTDAVLPKEN